MRIIALEASAAGNCTVKVPELLDLSAPKSSTRQVGSPPALSLYRSAPRAVIVDEAHAESSKSVKAVVPLVDGSTLVNVFPAALYPVPLISLAAVYAVVAAVKEALLVYRANLNVLPPEFLKLCTASNNSPLKEVHIKLPVNAIYFLLKR
jgi:hypothetical protein